MEIKNAKITSTMLGREDHGIMTFMIFIEDDVGSVGVGGYALDQYDRDSKTRVFSAKGIEVVSKILEVVGVNTWEQLPGKYIRYKFEGWGSTVKEIGNLIENKWLSFPEFFND